MSSLIEGWFQLTNGHPFVDDSPDTTTSPRKTKSYLSIYDSCATLGPISSGVFAQCELRLFPGTQVLEGKVVHAHGRFSVITMANEDEPHRLQVEVHRFVVTNIDPASDDTPGELHTSVTLSGRVVSAADATDNGADKFFTLEVSDYIRDRIQTFNIWFAPFLFLFRYFLIGLHRCRLNRTTSRRWEKTTVPTHGTTVLVSGYIDGENVGVLRVEIETMQFITPARGGEGVGFPRTPGKTRFGIPVGFVFIDILISCFANDTLIGLEDRETLP